jgi:beta-glucosidase
MCLFLVKMILRAEIMIGLILLVVLESVGQASFPAGFKWCSATAAHQVEGNNYFSDWWAFEQVEGHIRNNDRSGIAANQWNLLNSDIERMRELKLNSYRFSIEWAKLQPQPDQWDSSVLLHYQRQVRKLKKAGIEPIVTLNHFTLPQWVAVKGGWSAVENIEPFLRYSEKVFRALREDVTYWVTFNEPMVLITSGYLEGVFPPARKGAHELALQSLKNILVAHANTVDRLRALDLSQKAQFGFAHHLRVFDAANPWSPMDRWMAAHLDQVWNWSFTEALTTGRFKMKIPLAASIDVEIPKLKGSQDFFGLNYYSRDRVAFSFTAPYFKRLTTAGASQSDLGWEIYPQGLGRLLDEVYARFPNLPILITENGIADAKDQQRAAFIRDHLIEIENALDRGINVVGYCHWSLIDNFEWAEGFTPRFGLYEVDYRSQKRTPRSSALIMQQIIKANTAEMPILSK